MENTKVAVSRDGSVRLLEFFLIVTTVGLTALLYKAGSHKMVVLNLFYLPVVLGGFYLGRYRAGVLALLCVVSASIVTAVGLTEFAAYTSPLTIGLAVTVWGAVLGMTALLVGTLSDERASRMVELHEAYLGVVEVLSTYLQSGNPTLKARSRRVAELSQCTAEQLRLSSKQIDDIRVAAMLHEMEHIEVTAKVIRKAMGSLEGTASRFEQHTFHGTDLVQSMGSVLRGALPLLLKQRDDLGRIEGVTNEQVELPLGARIIRAARAFEILKEGEPGKPGFSTEEVMQVLRRDADADPTVLDALERVVTAQAKTAASNRSQAERLEAPEALLIGS